MKAFVAVALAAAAQAAPEADPQVLLAQPLVYGNAHTQVEAQVQHANGAVVPGETLSVKAAKAQHLTAKANAYLNKPLVYTAPVVNTPVVHQTLPVVHQTVASPVVSYTGYPHVFGTRFIKREADAEAQPEAEADPALLIPGTYRGVYSAGVVGAHHLVKPITYTTGLTTPVVGTVDTGLKFHPASGAVTPDFTEAQKEAAPELAANQKAIKHLAYTGHVNPLSHVHHIPAVVNQVVKPVVTYNGLTTPVVSTPVVNTVATKTFVHPLYDTTHVVHLGKREAEAEADPEAYFYRNYYNAPTYTGYTQGLRTYAYNYNPVYNGLNRGAWASGLYY